MSEIEIVAVLHGEPAAVITSDHGVLSLSYLDEYRAASDRTPLSTSLPLQVRKHPHPAVSAYLWGLLPDNDRVLQRWARAFQVSATNPAALLSSPVGLDCAGAVQFMSSDQVDTLVGDTGVVDWLSDDDIIRRLRALARDHADWLGDPERSGQFSLAGAQAKTALRYDPQRDRWGVPSGTEPTTHIIKPGIADLEDHALNEHLSLTAARRLGLRAARSDLRTFGDQCVIVVERFDRLVHQGRVMRIHQEDLCQALTVHPDGKYQQDGGPGPHEIVALFRRVLPQGTAITAIEGFIDALLFNWLIGGTDAHGKNYGLLLSGSQVRTAPLYDVASMLPYEPDAKQLKLAMKIGGEYRFKAITGHHWIRLADELDLEATRILERGIELAENLPAAFEHAAAAPVVRNLASTAADRLISRTAQWAQSCRRTLARSAARD